MKQKTPLSLVLRITNVDLNVSIQIAYVQCWGGGFGLFCVTRGWVVEYYFALLRLKLLLSLFTERII